jgi:hypothetical protein
MLTFTFYSNAEYHYTRFNAKSHFADISTVMLSVIGLSVAILSDILLTGTMLNVDILSICLPSVIILTICVLADVISECLCSEYLLPECHHAFYVLINHAECLYVERRCEGVVSLYRTSWRQDESASLCTRLSSFMLSNKLYGYKPFISALKQDINVSVKASFQRKADLLKLFRTKFGAKTLSITTLSIEKLSIDTQYTDISMATLSIKTVSIKHSS